MSNYIKIFLFTLTLLISFKAFNQNSITPGILNYSAICDQNELFENHTRINPRILSRTLSDDIYNIALDVYGNCSISDTSWLEFSGDTLHLWTGPRDTIIEDTRIIIVSSECDCFFHISYDIIGLADEPNTICFNGNEIKESNDKFHPEEYITLKGKQYLLFDSCGRRYEYSFYESGVLKRKRIEYGLLAQIWHYSETGKLTEIWTDNRAIENGKMKKVLVNNGG